MTFYRVDGLSLRSAEPSPPYQVEGAGSWALGGEVAVLQEAFLEVTINGEPGIVLESGRSPPTARLPNLSIELAHRDPPSPLRVYSLTLVVRPSDAPPPARFLRADSNGDGGVDISDPIHTLLWLFAGGGAPGCLDAADADDTGAVDVTDPIAALDWLFRGGPAPPPPGPHACGLDAGASLGCEQSPLCPL